ncbi:MAG: D-alanine--D-alanine ligase, partial [Phycisphaerae bacterium]|nr:D-alanine--D-alanine ligase [Phycisphaerae bacterium]
MLDPLTVLVLGGGPDRERPVSLRSAAAVAAALRRAGHEVIEADVLPEDTHALDQPCDVVFPLLHGPFGEGGPLQHLLEARHLAYVGSGPQASAVAMDKIAAKRVAVEQGLLTPPWQLLQSTGELELPPPMVIKPV